MRVALIAAHDADGVIGRDGGLPWRLPDDMRYFKGVTMGKPLIMGRKTYASIGRPLPGRANIVLTRNLAFDAPGCTVVHSPDAALEAAEAIRGVATEIMVIGGAAVYALFLPLAARLYLTRIDARVGGDVMFPSFDANEWAEVWSADHPADERHAYSFTFVVLDRVRPGA